MTNQPKHKISMGKVQAAVWTNEHKKENGDTFVISTVSIEKRYKNAQGEWRGTNSYDVNELADLIMVAEDARRFLKKKQDESD